MYIERGSTWNKWDFHVHTPYSVLNNQFGFDEYVKTLFLKAVENGVVAIGITDYFSIDGYKRIRQEYLAKQEKMKVLFPDNELRAKIEKIYVFPNIELRLDTFVGEKEHSVNYHIIFSGEVDCNTIEERVLRRLSLNHNRGTVLPVSRASFEQIGREYKQNNLGEKRNDYHVGLEKAAIHHTSVIGVLQGCEDLSDKYFLSIPVDEDLSVISWSGRNSETRRILYQQCHMLMSSNVGTRKFALAKGHEEERKRELGSIKPCIWGSDAHGYERMFRPNEDRYCWIKAEATFEGLKQILYEPADRVKIQKDKPEEKDEHQVIDYIAFHDDNFDDAPIYFSQDLTTIICGKSTGKSILLRHIAKCVDETQVKDKEKYQYQFNKKLEANAEVVWKDGVSGDRKIIYIPQSWLNRVVDESCSDSALNKMLKEILLQQPDISSAHSILTQTISEILNKTKQDIDDYVECIKKVKAFEKQLSETGRSAAFKATIKKLEQQREELSSNAGITEELLKKYTELEKQITNQNDLLEKIVKEKTQLDFLKPPCVYISEITINEFDGSHGYDFSSLPTVKDILEQAIENINLTIDEIWEPAKKAAYTSLTNRKAYINESLTKLNEEYEPLRQIVAQNDQLKMLENQLKEEKQRLRRAEEVEKQKREKLDKAEKLKKKIIESRQTLRAAYDEYSKKLAAINSSDTSLKFEAMIENRRKDLFDAISSLFDNRNLKSFRDSGYRFSDEESLIIDDGLFTALWNAATNGMLSFRAGNSLKTVLEKLFSDWFYVHYVVSSGRDTINSMSPGKKALVLLELIVNLEKGKCPILIDQPEDDLDNRSIYKDLVKYLKDKKHERQIIVVTHNANVVIGADAEEVIIANQDGKETENHSKRFEYRCGAIENVSPVLENGVIRKGVLSQKGIQEQICDILEGGKDAFEKRHNKYFNVG